MPPRSPAPKGESKTGLVVTLIIFILFTIGLGVSTYYGFAEQEKLTQDKKAAEDKATIYKNEREYYRGQSWLYLAYMGYLSKAPNIKPAELTTWKTELDSNALAAFKSKSPPEDKDVVSRLIREDLDKKFGWNPAENRPVKTFDQMVQKEEEDNQILQKKIAGLEDQVAKLEKDKKELRAQLQEEQNNYQTALAQLQKKTQDDRSSDRDSIAKLENEMKKQSDKFADDYKRADEDRRKIVEESKKKDVQIADLRKLTHKQEIILQQAQEKIVADRQPVFHPDWQIVRMDSRGTMPYINLGTADRVKPQLTFSIHGIDIDGKPSPAPKGSLEVVTVLGEHLSQARVTSVKDSFRDPIMKGDVLHNPSWDPNLRKHVAVAGIIDLTGSGRDDTLEFIRNLERQNIIVDAYLDSKTGKIKGRVTVDTDYLIVSDLVENMSPKDRNPTLEQAIATSLRSMKDDANKNGVQILSLRKYLDVIGYRLPNRLDDGPIPSLYYRSFRPDLAPSTPLDRPAGGARPQGGRLPADRPMDQPPPLPPPDK